MTKRLETILHLELTKIVNWTFGRDYHFTSYNKRRGLRRTFVLTCHGTTRFSEVHYRPPDFAVLLREGHPFGSEATVRVPHAFMTGLKLSAFMQEDDPTILRN
jgi:hypothetical protein